MAGNASAVAGRYPPGPSTPRLYQTWRFTTDFIEFMESCQRRYGDVFTIRRYPRSAYVVATAPADIHAVLFDKERFGRANAAASLAPIIGDRSVILLTGEDHMRQRKLLLPSFHGERIKGWDERIEAITAEELDRLPTDEPVALRPVMQRIAFNVICRLVLGMEDSARIAELNAATIRLWDPRFAPLLGFPFMFRRGGRFHPSKLFFARRDPVDRFIFEEIERHRANPDVAERDDLLSMLIAAGAESDRPLSDEELRDEMLGLLNAGHETTASGLAWTAERLSRNPATQQRLVEELEGGGDKYLEAVIQEVLRIRPSLVGTVRSAIEDTELGGHPIPAGTAVGAMFSITQRNASYWEDPLAFKPERFLDGKPEPHSYIPFGGGIRRCIGAPLATSEMRIVTRALLRRFRIGPADTPEEGFKVIVPSLLPAKGGVVVLHPVGGQSKRTTGLEPATSSLGSSRSTS